jgi:SAM-dependent methyltransferase
MNERPVWSAQRLTSLAQAYWPACALQAAVQTGLTAELAKGPAAPEELASRLGLDGRGLGMLLTALLHLEVAVAEEGRYHLHPEVQPFLSPESGRDLSNAVLHMADMVADWAQLAQCVRSGRPVERPEPAEGGPSPQRAHFYRAMRDLARQQARGLAARLGLAPGQRLLDLGGGPGVYACTFAAEVPGLEAAVFDLPGAREHFQEERRRHPGAEGVEFLAGDYRKDPLGGPYDVVWLSQVLHGAGPAECQRLVEAAAGALAPGGVLWVQEFIVDPTGQGHVFPALFGLNMLVNTSEGRSYTRDEIAGMMAAAGLEEPSYQGPTAEGAPAQLMRAAKPA